MNIILLDAGTLGDDLSFDVLSSLGTLRVYATTSPDELSERVRDADVLILNKIKITRQVLAFAPRLRLICITATGYDNIDVAAAREMVATLPAGTAVMVELKSIWGQLTTLPPLPIRPPPTVWTPFRWIN